MSSVAYDTLILSDVHLGAEVSRARAATRMLQENSFRRLILLGDIFADLNFGRLKKEHWKFLGLIRKLSNPKRGIDVVWVEGNHDLRTDQRDVTPCGSARVPGIQVEVCWPDGTSQFMVTSSMASR